MVSYANISLFNSDLALAKSQLGFHKLCSHRFISAQICHFTSVCAYSKPRNIFESVALPHFQKYFRTTQSLNRLYYAVVLNFS